MNGKKPSLFFLSLLFLLPVILLGFYDSGFIIIFCWSAIYYHIIRFAFIRLCSKLLSASLFMLLTIAWIVVEQRLFVFIRTAFLLLRDPTIHPVLDFSARLLQVAWPDMWMVVWAGTVALFLFVGREKFRQALYALIPNRYFEVTARFFSQTAKWISGYTATSLFQASIFALIWGCAFYLLHIPYAAALTLVMAASALTPFFGIWLGAGLATSVLYPLSVSLFQIIGLVIALAIVVFLRYGILYDKIFPLQQKLSPLYTLLYATIGYFVFGLFGLLFLPAAGSIAFILASACAISKP